MELTLASASSYSYNFLLLLHFWCRSLDVSTRADGLAMILCWEDNGVESRVWTGLELVWWSLLLYWINVAGWLPLNVVGVEEFLDPSSRKNEKSELLEVAAWSLALSEFGSCLWASEGCSPGNSSISIPESLSTSWRVSQVAMSSMVDLPRPSKVIRSETPKRNKVRNNYK